MKKIIPFIFAGIFGGLVVLGGLYFIKVENIHSNGFESAYATQVSSNFNLKPGSSALPFDFTEGDPLPAGRYNYLDYGMNYSSDQRKRFGFNLRAESGGFYNGQRVLLGASAQYRVQPWGNFTFSAEYNRLKFPENYGERELWLIGPRAEVNFSKNLFWNTFVQYNTQDDNFNINSRLQWQFRPLSWLFLVYTDNYAVEVWGPKNRAVVLKLNYWLVL